MAAFGQKQTCSCCIVKVAIFGLAEPAQTLCGNRAPRKRKLTSLAACFTSRSSGLRKDNVAAHHRGLETAARISWS